MARIPEVEIERLKKEIAIERLVMGFGIELKRQGAELVGRCPFHEDPTPSLVVSPKTNLWHCMGSCNVGGSTIDWVMKILDLMHTPTDQIAHSVNLHGMASSARRTASTRLVLCPAALWNVPHRPPIDTPACAVYLGSDPFSPPFWQTAIGQSQAFGP